MGYLYRVVYTPCIHGTAILESEAKRQMDLGSFDPGSAESDGKIREGFSIGGRRMIYIVCQMCGKHDTVPKVINQLEICFSCYMDRIPYESE